MSHASLSAAADERKARLLQLKSLKRKAPSAFDEDLPPHPTRSPSPPPGPPAASALILSGRNYDPETKGPKLGFETAPIENLEKPTLEEEAAAIERKIREKREEEERKAQGDGGGMDLEQLRPKKPNWDLKRDLERKMEVLGVRTDNAIARMVRERIEGAKAKAREKGEVRGDGEEEVGMEGVNLVERVRQMEREDEKDVRRFGGDVDINE